MAMVAAGQLDAALNTNCKLWDIAAGWVLVTAAGGVVSTAEGDALFPLDVATYGGEELPTLAASADVYALMMKAP
jgi:myo-inositol-1(or 4)-monophosphatase